MAKLRVLPEQAIIDGFKGKIDFYLHDGVACARKWPRSPGHLRAPSVMAWWPIFSDAAKLWSTLSPEVQQAYIDMAAPSDLTGKDLFTRGYISGIFKE